MGKRREPRKAVSIPVRVYGTDCDGNPFSQTATTLDVSRTGARLTGIRCLRGAGDIITIEYGRRSARFSVAWVGVPGSHKDGQFGVRCLQPEMRIFGVDPGESKPDTYVPPVAVPSPAFASPPPTWSSGEWNHYERRAAKRMKCSGTCLVTQAGVQYPTWTQISDLSTGGCYLESIFPIPPQTRLKLTLTINERSVNAKGIVVTSHPGLGFGVKFIFLEENDRNLLAKILAELAAAQELPGVDSLKR